jgi:hypothetical protein
LDVFGAGSPWLVTSPGRPSDTSAPVTPIKFLGERIVTTVVVLGLTFQRNFVEGLAS